MSKILFLKTLLLFCFLWSCGFKVVNQSELINFNISSISVSGDNRISFKIKNKLLQYSKNNGKKLLNLDIDVKKNKEIKEKNIKNEITKFEISIASSIQYGNNEGDQFEITKKGDYTVTGQYSQTLNNEKKLINVLTESLVEDVIEELIQRTNDL